MKIIITITLIFAVTISCGGNKTLLFYDSEKKNDSEIAIVEIGNVFLMKIDTLEKKYQALNVKNVELLPGKHILGVRYKSWKGNSRNRLDLEFTAEAGHTYIVKAKAGYKFWTSWILDIALDSVVAGSKNLSDREHRGQLN